MDGSAYAILSCLKFVLGIGKSDDRLSPRKHELTRYEPLHPVLRAAERLAIVAGKN
jgi:hypothetical protein